MGSSASEGQRGQLQPGGHGVQCIRGVKRSVTAWRSWGQVHQRGKDVSYGQEVMGSSASEG